MNIMLNNKPEKFQGDTMTVQDLLDRKKFTFKLIVVKINDKLIKRDQYDKAVIRDGDNVMVIHLVSGG